MYIYLINSNYISMLYTNIYFIQCDKIMHNILNIITHTITHLTHAF